MAVRNGILQLNQRVEALQATLTPAVESLLVPAGSPRYGRVVAQLAAGEAVLVLGEGRERAVPVAEMFAQTAGEGGGAAGRVFVGEDRLTGALLTMGLEQPPRVVFVSDSPVSAFGERGRFRHVAERLLVQDFELAEWTVGGGGAAAGGGPGGASGGGGFAPPPVPDDGAAVVWVVPPLDLQQTSGSDREQVAALLGRRLARGDGVLLNFVYDPEASYRSADPLAELARSWGVGVERHRVVLHESVTQDRRRRASPASEVSDWPGASPLSGAMTGRSGTFVLASPLTLDPPGGTRVSPLVSLTNPRQWLAEGLTSQDAMVAAAYDPETAADEVVIAAAAERDDGGRMIVFGEPHWATDNLAARNLGNSELFITASTGWRASTTRSRRRQGPRTSGGSARWTTRPRWGFAWGYSRGCLG